MIMAIFNCQHSLDYITPPKVEFPLALTVFVWSLARTQLILLSLNGNVNHTKSSKSEENSTFDGDVL